MRHFASTQDGAAERDVPAWDGGSFLEKVLNVAPNIIYVFNQQTQSNEYSNRSLGASLGYTEAELQALGSELLPRLCHPDDLPKIYSYFTALRLMPDGEISTLEYRMRNKAGGWSWLMSYDTIFERDEAGEVLRHIGMATDITARKQAEELVRVEKQFANKASQDLRTFSHSVLHDIKSPVHALNLMFKRLASLPSVAQNEEALELVGLSLETLTQMEETLHGVLQFTRVLNTSNKHERTSTNDAIKAACDDLNDDIAASGAQLQINSFPDVIGDALQLQLLFRNTIENAIKFTKPGNRPVITIDHGAQSNDLFVCLTVSDSGIGIAEQYHQRVFGMFQRLHFSDDYKGRGLGLAICARIIQDHAGSISLTSELDKGTSILIELPRA